MVPCVTKASFVPSPPQLLGAGAPQSKARRLARAPRRPRPSPLHCCAAKEPVALIPAPAPTPEPRPAAASFAGTFPERIPTWLVQRLSDLGFTTPTAVQLRALQVALPPGEPAGSDGGGRPLGRDTVIHAQTGCGKTLAYLLPAIAAIDPTRASVQALVLVPTQELGIQVYRTLKRLTVAWSHAWDEEGGGEDDESAAQGGGGSGGSGFPVLPMLNQADLRRQKLQLRKTAPRIIVGNPHRVAALVESGRLRLDLLRVLVVDEFDACLLDTSTTSALQTVLSVRGRERRQTILASATVPQHRHFLRQCVRQRWTQEDIEHVWVEESEGQRVPSSLRHCYAVVDGRKKLSALRTLLLRFGREAAAHVGGGGGPSVLLPRAIVFIMVTRPVTGIVDALNAALHATAAGTGSGRGANAPVVGLADDMSVLRRARAMRRFRSGDARVLVATDVAARGLDVDGITHVFHVDLATDADAYLHRAGRAGRLGREGVSVALVTAGEEFVIRRTGNALGIDFERVGGRTAADGSELRRRKEVSAK
jgi:superfamily II DNA/RNA helicase